MSAYEAQKEKEVRKAAGSLIQPRRATRSTKKEEAAVLQLADSDFNLFCSAHVDYTYSTNEYRRWRKNIEFHHDPSEPDELHGQIFINETDGGRPEFGPFPKPTEPSTESIKVETNGRKRYELAFQFLGNGNMIVRVPQGLAFDGLPPPPAGAPDVFEFVGIARDKEKDRQNLQKQIKRPRPASPRESMFRYGPPGYDSDW